MLVVVYYIVAAVFMAALSGERHVKASVPRASHVQSHALYCVLHYQLASVTGWWLDVILTLMGKSVKTGTRCMKQLSLTRL